VNPTNPISTSPTQILDKVVQRAAATHCTTIEKGYMVMKNVWIWRVKVSGVSEK
jgi:hypothetical protein